MRTHFHLTYFFSGLIEEVDLTKSPPCALPLADIDLLGDDDLIDLTSSRPDPPRRRGQSVQSSRVKEETSDVKTPRKRLQLVSSLQANLLYNTNSYLPSFQQHLNIMQST